MVEDVVKKRYRELLNRGYSPSVALRKTETEFGEPGSEKRERFRKGQKTAEARSSEHRAKGAKTKVFGRARPGGGFLSDLASAGRGVVRGIGKAGRYIESSGFQRRVGAMHSMSTSLMGFGEEPRKKRKHHRKAKKKHQPSKSGGKRRMVKIYYY